MLKRILKIVLILVGIVVALAAALVLYLTVTEYKPQAVEDAASLQSSAGSSLSAGSEVSILSWNIGYSGLGAGSDFFMDGGKDVRSADKSTVESYLSGIQSVVDREQSGGCSLVLLQEVDRDSTRSYHIDQAAALASGDTEFALNYSCRFVPYPMPPIGKVEAGLLTVSGLRVEKAERIALPTPFSWPVRAANLKRCLLVSYLPIQDSDKYLVVVNLHLEAYDDGSGKAAQTAQLKEFLESEYEKGNYVIAGGDFNQEFPGALEAYPNTHTDLWSPSSLDESMIPDGFRFACDTSVPSCRLDNQPYDASDTENSQYYVIDGFILSPNVTLKEVSTLDEGFAFSDHNPVRLTVALTEG